jgi:hypothetical protein
MAGKTALKKHLASINQPGALLYVDKVDNNRVLSQDVVQGGQFVSYLVGFCDSALNRDAKVQQEKGVYYQFHVMNDWKAVVGGDSIAPVFYHPVVKLNSQEREGVLVFELSGDAEPEALVYRDATGLWGTQIIVLNATK